MGLIKDVKANGILAFGVLKLNRMEVCVLNVQKNLRKQGQGSRDTRVYQSGGITVLRWLDNGIVNLASIFVGTGNPDTVKR